MGKRLDAMISANTGPLANLVLVPLAHAGAKPSEGLSMSARLAPRAEGSNYSLANLAPVKLELVGNNVVIDAPPTEGSQVLNPGRTGSSDTSTSHTSVCHYVWVSSATDKDDDTSCSLVHEPSFDSSEDADGILLTYRAKLRTLCDLLFTDLPQEKGAQARRWQQPSLFASDTEQQNRTVTNESLGSFQLTAAFKAR